MGFDPMDASNKMTFVVSPGDGSAAKARCCRGRHTLGGELRLLTEKVWRGGEWQYPTNSLHRFFKVTVEMPQGRLEFAGVVLGFVEESKDATTLPFALTAPCGVA